MQGRGNAMRGLPMMVLMMAVVVVLVVGSTAVVATNYKVGDDAGWDIRSYDSWVANKTFVVGDTLEFDWTGTHDVVEVTEADYTACTAGNGQVYSTSGVKLNLTSTGPKYYICSVSNHCSRGMKMNLTVSAATTSPTTPSTPASPPSTTPSTTPPSTTPSTTPTTPTSPNTTSTPSPPNSSPLSLPPSIFTLFFLLGVTLLFFHSF